MNLRHAVALLALLAVFAPGCAKQQTTGTPPRVPREETVPAQKTAFGKREQTVPDANDGDTRGEKKGVMARVFGGTATPGYGWDGQMTTGVIKSPVSTVFGKAVETLRGMGFVINTEETRRHENTGKIQAAKADKTQALILVEEKVAGSTDIKIKVGQTGDRAGSERILDEVQKSKAAPKKAAPATPPPAPAEKK